MKLLTDLFLDIVIRIIGGYIKIFRYAGILFLAFVIECICLWVYCSEALGQVEVVSEEIQITDIAFEEGKNAEGEEGYRFYLTLKNDGSRRAIASGGFLYNDSGDSIGNEEPGVYQNVDGWDFLYSGVVVPPGTEATADFFVEKKTLAYEETEYLIFKTEWDGTEVTMPISEFTGKAERIGR